MDTKEHRRRRPAQEPEASGRRPERRRRPDAPSGASRQRRSAEQTPAARRRQAAAARSGPKSTAPRSRRVVRGPDQSVPEVRYSMPRPFSRTRFLLKLATVAAVVLAILACLSLFFRVETITVSGADKYTAYAIREASGISEGDALLGISEPRTAGKIISALPYVKEVQIIRHLPGSVHIAIREMDVTYAIEADNGSWWLIASDGRVVDSVDSAAASGYMKILGVRAAAPVIGESVKAAADQAPVEPGETGVPGETEQPEQTEQTQPAQQTEATEATEATALPGLRVETEADRLQAALKIADQLEQNAVIGKVVSVDVSSLMELSLEYENRFHVLLGDTEKLGYKIAAMAATVEQLEEYEIGELDVSFRFSEKVIFNPAGQS